MPVRSVTRLDALRQPRLEPLESRVQLSIFSLGPIVAMPGQLPPSALAPMVSNQSGFATVEVNQTSHGKASNATERVEVVTNGGTAQAGVDYAPIDQTLTFKPGQTKQAVIIPLLNSGKSSGQETVNIALIAENGSPSAAVTQNGVLTIPNQSTAGQPLVAGLDPVVKGHEIVQLLLTFNKAMDPASVQNPANYTVQLENIDEAVGSSNVPSLQFRSATYDPATLTVTLKPEKPFKTSTPYVLSYGSGIQDTNGDSLNAYATEFGAGSALTYPYLPEGCLCGSSEWRDVSMDLSGPGTMIVDNGVLYLVGTKPTQSTLSGINALPDAGTLVIVSPDGVIDHSRQS